MKDQHVQCGNATRLVYHEPQLDISVGGVRTSIRKGSWVERPQVAPGDPPTRFPMRGCLERAFFEPAQGIVVLQVVHVCHGAGGDWCQGSQKWHVVKLPRAPGPEPKEALPNECPAGAVRIPGAELALDGRATKVQAFCLDRTEVTVADYRACLRAGRCFPPEHPRLSGPGSWGVGLADPRCNGPRQGREAHPMNCVSQAAAEEYCAFSGKRLPTSAEWELAARGPEGRRFPWGEDEPKEGVCWKVGSSETCPAGSSAGDRSPLGVVDLAANVQEWTRSRDFSSLGCGDGSGYWVRGGAHDARAADDLYGAALRSESPHSRRGDLGFRCAQSLTRSP
jgi:hypothetical protein